MPLKCFSRRKKTYDSAIEQLVVNQPLSTVSSASYEKSDAGLNHDTNPIKIVQNTVPHVQLRQSEGINSNLHVDLHSSKEGGRERSEGRRERWRRGGGSPAGWRKPESEAFFTAASRSSRNTTPSSAPSPPPARRFTVGLNQNCLIPCNCYKSL